MPVPRSNIDAAPSNPPDVPDIVLDHPADLPALGSIGNDFLTPDDENDDDDLCDDDLTRLPYEERVQLAIRAVETGQWSQRSAAAYFRVTRGTVDNRMKGMPTRLEGHAHERKVSAAQRDVLAEHIKVLSRRGTPLSHQTINEMAEALCGAPVGETWSKRFVEKRSDLKIKWTTSIDEPRARALNHPIVDGYFDLLQTTIEEYQIKPENIYNMDEKGIRLGDAARIKAVVDRNLKTVRSVDPAGAKEMLTVVECVCATGEDLPPLLIVQGQRRVLAWGENNPCNASIAVSPNGWTDQDLGYLWLSNHFAPATADHLSHPNEWRLLILDGHNSHTTYRFLNFAFKNRILVLCLPAHTTHALQPCDVGIFGPLATAWRKQVSERYRSGVVIDKMNFLENYSAARVRAFKRETIMSAFRKCGIHPLDKNAIPESEFEAAVNYTNRAALPLPPVRSSLLVPIPQVPLPPLEPAPAPIAQPSASSRPSTPTHDGDNSHTRDVIQAMYTIALPSPVCKTASRQALAAENNELRRIALAAGVEIERSYAKLVLASEENGRLRQKVFAKKKGEKKTFSTTHARLLTSEETRVELLKALHKKQMKELHKGMKTALAKQKAMLRQAEKDAEAAAKAEARATKNAEKQAKAAEKEAAKVAKAANKAAANARGRGRGRGRARGRARRGQGVRGADAESDLDQDSGPEFPELFAPFAVHGAPCAPTRGRGGGRGRGSRRAAAEDDDDDDEIESSESVAESSENTDVTVEELADGESGPNTEDESESDGEETQVSRINGSRWLQGRHLQFQVVWMDGDITWEPLECVDDCKALEEYLERRKVKDPLLLSKRKYRIDTDLEAINE